ncbi:MAG: hypothetical protein RJA98_2570 [Pseudomonadota bacterium]|jgi:lysophospholipase L1-like esterase
MDISTNTTLVGGTHSNTPLYVSGTNTQLTLGAGWTKGMFVYAIAATGASFSIVAGTATLDTPTGTSASSATALAGIVALECVADGQLRAAQPAVAAAATAPGAPTALVLGTATATTQPLTWSAPASNGGSAITGYRVGVRTPVGSGAFAYSPTSSAATGYVVTGLTASTAYEYVVDAVNAVGSGADSSSASGSTASAVQPLRVVTRNNKQAQSGSLAMAPAGQLTYRCRYPIWMASADSSQLVLSLMNWYTQSTGVVLGANDFTVSKAAIEKDGATSSVPVLFSGARTKLIPAGATDVQSDPLLASAFGLSAFTNGDKYWVRLELTVSTAGQKIPAMFNYGTAGIYPGGVALWLDPVANTTVSQIDSYGNIAISGSSWTNEVNVVAPIVLGRFVSGNPKTFLAVGDSITEGSADALSGQVGNGYFDRARMSASNGAPMLAGIKFGQGSSISAMWSAANADRMTPYLAYAKYLWDMYGTNDFLAGETDATVRTRCQAIWAQAMASGASGVVRGEVLPRVTSSDSYVLAANQTYINSAFGVGGAARTFNTWLSTQVGGGAVLTVVPFDSVRDSGDRYKWKVNGTAGYATADGVHPSTAAHILMADELRPVLASLS